MTASLLGVTGARPIFQSSDGDLTITNAGHVPGAYLEACTRTYLPWEDQDEQEHSTFGRELLDSRDVLLLAEALDEWLRERGLR